MISKGIFNSISIFIFSFVLIFTFCINSFCSEELQNENQIPENTDSEEDQVYDDLPDEFYNENPVIHEDDFPIADSDNIIRTNVLRSVNPVSPTDTSGLKAVLLSLLGNYDAIVVEYQYQSSNGYYSYLREVQPDYVWLCSCALFLVVIYSIFRLIGGIFCDRKR